MLTHVWARHMPGHGQRQGKILVYKHIPCSSKAFLSRTIDLALRQIDRSVGFLRKQAWTRASLSISFCHLLVGGSVSVICDLWRGKVGHFRYEVSMVKESKMYYSYGPRFKTIRARCKNDTMLSLYMTLIPLWCVCFVWEEGVSSLVAFLDGELKWLVSNVWLSLWTPRIAM